MRAADAIATAATASNNPRAAIRDKTGGLAPEVHAEIHKRMATL